MAPPSDFSVFGKMWRLLKEIHFSPYLLIWPLMLSMVAACLEGASISLLIPLITGFFQKDFSFVKNTPILGFVLEHIPGMALISDRQLFVGVLGIFVVAVLLKNTLRYLSVISMAYFGYRARHHLRKTMFNRFMRFGKLYFDRTNVGHHSMALTLYTEDAFKPIISIDKYINAFLSLTVYLITMLAISWKITLFTLPLFGLLHFAIRWMIRRIRGLSYDITQQANDIGKQSIEILSTIGLVKASGTEDSEQKAFTALSNAKAKTNFRTNSLQELMLPLQESITLLAATVLFALMMYFMVKEGAPTSPFIVYFYLVISAAAKFGTLMGFHGVLASSVGPLQEIEKIFDDSDKEYVTSGNREFTGLTQSIDFRHLSFSYSADRPILRDVNFSIKKGSLTAIVGPTGAGKSTLVHLLMRYYEAPPQTIFLDGTDVREFHTQSLLSRVALVSQETMLLNTSLLNNITYGLENVSHEDVDAAVKASRLGPMIDRLPEGILTTIGDRGVQLSGGEKQRVSIARAFLRRADILILDEATSSLDSQTEQLIQEAVDEVVKGRTAIVIAHRLSTIRNAQLIVVVDEGTVVEEGSLEALLAKKGRFHALWEAQKFS